MKFARLGVKVNCPSDLLLFYDWRKFFEEDWGKKFRVANLVNWDIEVQMIKRVEGDVSCPVIEGSTIFFNEMLNPSWLLMDVRNMAADILVKKKIIMLHAACFIMDDKAYLVTGDSGSGKSTLLEQLESVAILGDDVTALRFGRKDRLWAYPSPFNLKKIGRVGVKKCEVQDIIFVNKGEASLMRTPSSEALGRLLHQLRMVMNNHQNASMGMKLAVFLSKRCYDLRYWLGDDVGQLLKSLSK